MALRPRLRSSSIASRNDSQALTDRMRLEFSASRPLNSAPNPVVTSLAGFAVSAFAFPLVERFSGLRLKLGLTVMAGFAASEPVVTLLAGFAGGRRPHAPGGRTPIPAAFR